LHRNGLHYVGLHVKKVLFFFVRFEPNLNFQDRFFVKPHKTNVHESLSIGNRLVPNSQGGGGDMTKLIAAFGSFENRPKNLSQCRYYIAYKNLICNSRKR
jgi:hypothetical protein